MWRYVIELSAMQVYNDHGEITCNEPTGGKHICSLHFEAVKNMFFLVQHVVNSMEMLLVKICVLNMFLKGICLFTQNALLYQRLEEQLLDYLGCWSEWWLYSRIHFNICNTCKVDLIMQHCRNGKDAIHALAKQLFCTCFQVTI